MDPLQTISPIDGRYRKYTEPLAKFFSEEAFMRYRIKMEVQYLTSILKITNHKHQIPNKLADNFTAKDAKEIKKIEATTNHDLKAIEYWIKSKLPKNIREWVHFGLTSEDATNIAYAMMVRDALREIVIPRLEDFLAMLHVLCSKFHDIPMLARTHGQPASPTTFGKEINVFAARLNSQIDQLKKWRPTAKLNGASGNYNALTVAFPKTNWVTFSKKFIASLGLEPNLITTQVEPFDRMIELFDLTRRINMILLDFCQDMWRYISDDLVVQKAVAGEVGSSTMPHKINPIMFENAEGNLGLANALFNHFALKLPISRLQRDLSDSTVKRSIGSAFAYCLIAYTSLVKGLERVAPNPPAMLKALQDHPEVITEAIQTILRREGVAMPYEKLKELARGKKITLQDLTGFIDSLEVSDKIKRELRPLTPEKYLGLARQLADV